MRVRKMFAALLAIVLVLSLAGCGGASTEMDFAADNGYAEMAPGDLSAGTPEQSPDSNSAPEGRKWIVTIDMNAETEDLDTLLAGLNDKIASLGGYLESRDIYNGSGYANYRSRSANLTIRVPADKADSLTEHIAGASNVVSNNKRMEDVTLSYVATESRMKALQTEEARLLELMAQAETMSDLLEIEARLTDVRYELESVTSQLKVYDNLVDYATIHLYISEVREYTPVEEKTVWQRITGGFVDSLEDIGDGMVEFFIWLVVSSPYLVLWGAIGTGIFFLVRKCRKGKKPPKPIATNFPTGPKPEDK